MIGKDNNIGKGRNGGQLEVTGLVKHPHQADIWVIGGGFVLCSKNHAIHFHYLHAVVTP